MKAEFITSIKDYLNKPIRAKITNIINKYDLSFEQTALIEEYCKQNNIIVALKIPFDKEIVHAISRLEIPSLTDVAFFKTKEWNTFIKTVKE